MNTNIKSLRGSVEEVARKYLGIPALYKRGHGGTSNLTDKQIEKSLREAFKMGEKEGYDHGFNDAKTACECSLDEQIIPIKFDKQNRFV